MGDFDKHYYYYDVANSKEKELVDFLRQKYFSRFRELDINRVKSVNSFFWRDDTPDKLEGSKFNIFRYNDSFWNNPIKIFIDDNDNFVAMQFLSTYSVKESNGKYKNYSYYVTLCYEPSSLYCYQIKETSRYNDYDMFWKNGHFEEIHASSALKNLKRKEDLDKATKEKNKIKANENTFSTKVIDNSNAFCEEIGPKYLFRYLRIFLSNQKLLKKQPGSIFSKMVATISLKGDFSIPYVECTFVNGIPNIKNIYIEEVDNHTKYCIENAKYISKINEFNFTNLKVYKETSEVYTNVNNFFQSLYDGARAIIDKKNNLESPKEEVKESKEKEVTVKVETVQPVFQKEETKKDNKENMLINFDQIDKFESLYTSALESKNFDEAFKYYDSLSDDTKKELRKEYLELCNKFNEYVFEDKKLRESLAKERISVREVYVSKSFEKQYKKYIASNPNLVSDLNNVITHMKKDNYDNLMGFFRMKNYNKTGEFSKIRFGTGETRILFLFGGQFLNLEKTKNAIYIVDIFVDHDYSYDDIRQRRYQNEKYHIFSKDNRNEGAFLYEPTNEQKKYIVNNSFPSLCVGCAGSGKTSVSIHKYHNIVNTYFYAKPKLESSDVIYITFSSLLRDKATEQLTEVVDTPYCSTVDEFFKEVLKKKNVEFNHKIATIDTFNKFLHEVYFKSYDAKKKPYINAIKKKDEYVNYTYTFYRGLYKGSMLDFKRKNLNDNISEKEFMDSLSDDAYFSELDKKALYDICISYQKYLQENELYDDTDLALFALKEKDKQPVVSYNYMIIDEVQDLTELQLFALISYSSRNYNICFYGDANQSINPTIFDVKKIDSCLMKATSSNICIRNKSKDELAKTFRSGEKLIKYLNTLISLRKEKIGASSFDSPITPYETTYKEKYWANYINDEDLIKYTLEASIDSVDTAIIVNTEKQKESLLNRYNQLRGKARVYTIFEAKGLEWDTVILYNFLSYENTAYKKIVSGENKNSRILRMIFNRYYVGCTRAIKSLLILEDHIDESVKDLLLRNKMSKISNRNKLAKDEIDTFIDTDADATKWYNSAEANFSMGFYEQAITLYKKAIALDQNNKEYKAKLDSAEYMLAFRLNKVDADISKANNLFNQHAYRPALEIYDDLNDRVMVNSCKVMLKETLSYAELHEIFDNDTLYNKEILDRATNQFDIDDITKEINGIIQKMKGAIK